jgi:hypothetical protein
MAVSRGERRWWAWWLTVLLLLGPTRLLAQEDCIKLVFGRYCLGGDVDRLLQQGPQPQFKQTQGERIAYIFREGPEQIYVLAFRNRIYKVLRRYRSATQLRYEDLYAVLRGKYGPGEDRSRFPPYATTASRKLGSIRRGDGQALHHWKSADDWHVDLTWTREMGLSLAYVATALDTEQKATAEQGF